MRISDMVLQRINRDYVLPSIQREFVWLSSPTKEKLKNCLTRYFRNIPSGQYWLGRLISIQG